MTPRRKNEGKQSFDIQSMTPRRKNEGKQSFDIQRKIGRIS
jgi:hypothetical protein